MSFNIVDLRLIVKIAEANSITRGAELSFMSLPAASIRIKNLEESIGAKLFTRTRTGVTLTHAGQVFEQHARSVLAEIQHLSAAMQEFSRGIKGEVRLFAMPSAVNEYLPFVLRNFLFQHPNINIDLHERLSCDTLKAVEEGIADIGLVAGNVATTGLEFLPYRQERLVLVTPKTHELSSRKEINFIETLEFDQIGLSETGAFSIFMRQICHDLHRNMKIRIRVSNFESSCRIIEAGVGVGILPESTARRHAQNLEISVIPLLDSWAIRNIMICIRDFEQLPKFAQELVKLLILDAGQFCSNKT